MNDIEKRDYIPSTSNLAKQGVSAVFCVVGGGLLFILQVLSRFKILGLAIGAVVCVIGISALLSKDPDDRKPGLVITAAGALTLLSKIPFIAPIAGTLLSVGALGLLAMGIVNAVKFFTGLKKRSE
jgi:predicted membrane protein